MKKFISMMMLACAVAFAGCSDDDDDNNVPDITFDPAKPEAVAPQGGSVVITMNVDNPSAESNKEWAVPTVSGTTLTVEVDANTTTAARNAVITVKKGDKTGKVTIKQNASSTPTPEVTEVQFGAGAEEKTIAVTSDSEFTATPDATWITATAEAAAVKIAVAANPGKEPRTGKVVLSAGGPEATITVTQIGNNIVPEVTEVNFGYAAGEKEIAVTASEAFTATASASWITATAKTSSVVIKVAAATANRTGTVTLTMGSLKAEITVTQSKASYNDYIGTWTLSYIDADSGQSGTTTVQITAKENGKFYTASGLGGSTAAQQYPITLGYDAASGKIQFLGQQTLGKVNVTMAPGEDPVECDFLFVGSATLPDGKTYFITSDKELSYEAFTGTAANGTIELVGETVSTGLGDGDFVSMGYIASEPGPNGRGGALEGDFAMGLPMTMTKTSDSVAPASMSPAGPNVMATYKPYRINL